MQGAVIPQVRVAGVGTFQQNDRHLGQRYSAGDKRHRAAVKLELLETRNFNLRQENKELKEALEEERSFSDRLLEGIDRVLDMLERHLPKQLLHLVDKARELLPEHQNYRQEKQHERSHSWGDMSL